MPAEAWQSDWPGPLHTVEAARLIKVPRGKLVRWLRGHQIGSHSYERLWAPQVDLQDGPSYLGFRDLIDARVRATGCTDGRLETRRSMPTNRRLAWSPS